MHAELPNEQAYRTFIEDPQAYGAWCLSLDFSQKGASSIDSLLNLGDWRYYGRLGPRFGPDAPPYERSLASAPILVPRLFAYLRSCLPKAVVKELPTLTPEEDLPRRAWRHRYDPMTRLAYVYRNVTSVPTTLGETKRKKLKEAARIYRHEFATCRLRPVPENATKADFVCTRSPRYFQVTEETPGAVMAFSPCEETLTALRRMLEGIGGVTVKYEMTKVFSPENTLMEMYLPVVTLLPPGHILRDEPGRKTIVQALAEAAERRYVHSIRATAIGAEELLVQIFETYTRQKAPEAPLGNLLADLNTSLQRIVHGGKARKEPEIADIRRGLGKLIEKEKAKRRPNKGLLELATQVQKQLLPIIESLKSSVERDARETINRQTVPLFPAQVQRCVGELLVLRNRVSHRVQRGTSVPTVGYIEAAIALRNFIIAAKWWQRERSQIDYTSSRREIVEGTVQRSRTAHPATHDSS